jgi:hypothetical protein
MPKLKKIMQDLNWFMENWVFIIAAILVVAAIFVPDRQLSKMTPELPLRKKSGLANFFWQTQTISLFYVPLSRLAVASVIAAVAAVWAVSAGCNICGLWLIAIAVFLIFANIGNQFAKRNKSGTDWMPFTGLVIPAIGMILGGYGWVNIDKPWHSASGFWLAGAGACLAAWELAQKTKNPAKKSLLPLIFGLLTALFLVVAFYPQLKEAEILFK